MGNKEQFTPRPWKCGVSTCKDQFVYVLPSYKEIGLQEAEANANLIAASPDMYEVLDELIKVAMVEIKDKDIFLKAKAALNKANPQ
jgi:hypothetical protein